MRFVEMMDIIGRTGPQSIPRYQHDRLHPTTTMTDEVHDNEAYPPGIRRTSMAVAIPVDRVGAHVRDIRVVEHDQRRRPRRWHRAMHDVRSRGMVRGSVVPVVVIIVARHWIVERRTDSTTAAATMGYANLVLPFAGGGGIRWPPPRSYSSSSVVIAISSSELSSLSSLPTTSSRNCRRCRRCRRRCCQTNHPGERPRR